MKKFVRAMVVFAMVAACLLMLPNEAKAEEITSGTCGPNLTWTLDDTGTLTISGEGDIYAYLIMPWDSVKETIQNVIIEDGVTSIGDWAFEGCSGLMSVKIPNSVTSIGARAFYGCSGLTTLEIPNGATSIGNQAFYGCSGLTTIEIPDSVTSIDDFAFFDCSGLTTIKIPDGVTSIGGCTFCGCSGLTTIKIPDGVTYIGDQAFFGCSNLNDITLPDDLTYLGDDAFYGCSGLTTIKIPDGVTSIGDYAFYGCSGLTTIKIPDDVTYIGDGAFSGCSGLNDITLPDGLTYLGDGAFCLCSNLSGDIIIPDGVQSIGNGTFEECVGLLSVTIGKDVSSIGDFAFRGCSNLMTINIPNDVTYIGDWAFSECSALNDITLPDGLTYLGHGAFLRCSNLSGDIIIPDGVQSIGNRTFEGCDGLLSVTIGTNVGSIGAYAFAWCDSLTTFSIPEGITTIADETFAQCYSLTTIVIPKSVTEIGVRAFDNCYNLESVQYSGTWNEWKLIVIGESNECLTRVYCLESKEHTWVDGEIIHAPTCVEEGTRRRVCDICGIQKTVTIPKSTEHSYYEWWEYGDESFHKKTCYICGYEEIASHSEGEGWISIYPTCKDEGEKTYYCTECHGEIRKEAIPKRTEHSYFSDIWEYVDDGYHKRVCDICDYEDIVYHNWGEGWISAEPTCKSEGQMTYQCNICYEYKTEKYGDKLTEHEDIGWEYVDDDYHKQVCYYCGHEDLISHNWGEGWISAEPTCKSKGQMTYQCSICYEHKTEEYGDKLTKHSYGGWEKVDDDYHKQVCYVCGYEDIIRHNWGEGWISVEPTCKSEGQMSYHCSICYAYKTEKYGDKLTEHSAIGWENVDDNEMHKQVCYVCGYEDIIPHTWDYICTSKYPSCNEEGEESSYCYACGYIKTETIPMTTEHSYDACEPHDENSHKRICSVCGDEVTEEHSYYPWWEYGDESFHKKTCYICGNVKTEEHEMVGGISIHPTCATEGEMTYSCIICWGITRTETIPMTTEHSYGGWEKVDGDYHKQVCNVCEEIGAVEPHEWERDFEYSSEPTCLEPGWIYCYCILCGNEKFEELEALGHEYEDGVCTFCGDNDPDYVPSTQPSEPPVEPSEPSTQPSEPPVEPSEPSTQPSEPPVEPSEPTTEPQLDELGTKLAELEAIIVALPDIPEKEAILLSLASIRDSVEIPATEEKLNIVLTMFDELRMSIATAYPEGEAELALEKIAEIEAFISELLPEDNFEGNLSFIDQIIQLIMNWINQLLALLGL